MKELFTQLANNITTSSEFAASALEPIKHLDLYFSQYDNPEKEEVFEVPALFLEMSLQTDESTRLPKTWLSLTCHWVVQALEATAVRHGIATTPSLDIFTYRSIGRAIILKTRGETFGSIRFISTEPLQSLGPVLVLKENYTCAFYEDIARGYLMQQAADTEPVTVKVKSGNRSIGH